MPDNQSDYAEALASELEQCGHDDISAIDLLDALSSTGLRLTIDEQGAAKDAYSLMLNDRMIK